MLSQGKKRPEANANVQHVQTAGKVFLSCSRTPERIPDITCEAADSGGPRKAQGYQIQRRIKSNKGNTHGHTVLIGMPLK